jgi:hypothetical protein
MLHASNATIMLPGALPPIQPAVAVIDPDLWAAQLTVKAVI